MWVSMMSEVFQKWLKSLWWIALLESYFLTYANLMDFAFVSLLCYVLMYDYGYLIIMVKLVLEGMRGGGGVVG